MTTFLFFLLAVALVIIGMLLQIGEEIGGAFLGVIGAMSKKLGPGVSYKAPRPSRAHWFFYGGALLSIAGAIWRIFT